MGLWLPAGWFPFVEIGASIRNLCMDFPVVLFIMLFATFCKVNSSTPSATTGHLTTRNTIADVLVHPAFEGFAQYILPLEWGYDEAMPLSQVARLLPYHN